MLWKDYNHNNAISILGLISCDVLCDSYCMKCCKNMPTLHTDLLYNAREDQSQVCTGEKQMLRMKQYRESLFIFSSYFYKVSDIPTITDSLTGLFLQIQKCPLPDIL